MKKTERRYVFTSLFLLFICLLLGFPSVVLASDDTCMVTPKALTMDYTSLPEAGRPIQFTLDAVSDCEGSMYYYFSYNPDYGTSDYATSTNWINMRDVQWSTSNSLTYTFDEVGYYVVVAWVSPTTSAPDPLMMIGATITVVEASEGSDCMFNASALNLAITDALDGSAIEGATVATSTQSATTDSSGNATLMQLPVNQEVTVTVSATGYISQQVQVNIVCGQTQSQGLALLASDASGVSEGNIRVILTWGENPADLDSHLTGPGTTDPFGNTERFHVYYANSNNSSGSPSDSSIPAWLDVDDVTSYGPETITIQKVSGSFLAGTYRYYIHHYSGSSDIPNSGAIVQVYQGSTLIRTFNPPTSRESVADGWVWSVFEMEVSSSGSVSVSPVDTYSGPHYSDDSVFQFRAPRRVPEVYDLFEELPVK